MRALRGGHLSAMQALGDLHLCAMQALYDPHLLPCKHSVAHMCAQREPSITRI